MSKPLSSTLTVNGIRIVGKTIDETVSLFKLFPFCSRKLSLEHDPEPWRTERKLTAKEKRLFSYANVRKAKNN